MRAVRLTRAGCLQDLFSAIRSAIDWNRQTTYQHEPAKRALAHYDAARDDRDKLCILVKSQLAAGRRLISNRLLTAT
jgi:hypothetical protein